MSGARDTIFALASGAGRTGVSVFRISGPDAAKILISITGRPVPPARLASLRSLKDADGGLIDEALVLWMPGPNSFTGEDVAELHTHGSPAVREMLASALLALGLREAAPGEFTRRAFENGRMDLTEAEGLADLIDADTSAQQAQALRQMSGGLKDKYESWRAALIDALAAIEGEIDFPDEMDVPNALSHAAYAPIHQAQSDMIKMLEDADRGERVRSGIDITIIGPPNAGKSTLLNRLVGRDAAIVSDIAGTTRDIVDVQLVIAGLPVRVSDTAGLRDSEDVIEAEGVRRAEVRAANSDIRIAMIDGSDAAEISDRWKAQLKGGDILVINKSDLEPDVNMTWPEGVSVYKLSALTGDGFDAFHAGLSRTIEHRFSVSNEAGLTRARHKACVARAASSLARAKAALGQAPELAGDDVRAALHAIKELAGETDIEAVLDQVFSRFCIGK